MSGFLFTLLTLGPASTVGNATIVALGEGTHGTREFFQLEHRPVEFLAGGSS